MDIESGKVVWRHLTRTRPSSAALTTAGGLAIVGDGDRYLYVHDAANGNILFQVRLPGNVRGFPITYAVRGKQYVAIPVGVSGAIGGNTMFVFTLPERAAVSRR
jgi:alcohol dehydrogenase (cytochrome c)